MGNSNNHSHTENAKGSKSIDLDVENLFKELNPNGEEKLSLNGFLSFFSNSYIIRRLLQNNSLVKNSEEPKIETNKAKYIISEMYKTIASSSLFELYISFLFNEEEEISHEIITKIFEECFIFSMKSIGINMQTMTTYSKMTLNYLIDSIKFEFNKNTKVTNKTNLKDWIINEFPMLFYGFHSWFQMVIKNRKQLTDNSINDVADLSNFMNNLLTWYIVQVLPSCYSSHLSSESGSILEKLKNCLIEKRWAVLYDSESHGLSLNRFQSNLFNYKASTIMFILCQSGCLFCVCSNDEYKESPMPYGDSQTKAFRFWKDFKQFELESAKNIFLNTKLRQLKLGLIIGYSLLKPILKIDENFHCVEHELDKNDQIVSVEVWGCGSAKAALHQQDMKKWESKQIEKMRTSKFNPEFDADKTLLDLAGIKTEHSERGDI